jgi:hypothetical protein
MSLINTRQNPYSDSHIISRRTEPNAPKSYFCQGNPTAALLFKVEKGLRFILEITVAVAVEWVMRTEVGGANSLARFHSFRLANESSN